MIKNLDLFLAEPVSDTQVFIRRLLWEMTTFLCEAVRHPYNRIYVCNHGWDGLIEVKALNSLI